MDWRCIVSRSSAPGGAVLRADQQRVIVLEDGVHAIAAADVESLFERDAVADARWPRECTNCRCPASRRRPGTGRRDSPRCCRTARSAGSCGRARWRRDRRRSTRRRRRPPPGGSYSRGPPTCAWSSPWTPLKTSRKLRPRIVRNVKPAIGAHDVNATRRPSGRARCGCNTSAAG